VQKTNRIVQSGTIALIAGLLLAAFAPFAARSSYGAGRTLVVAGTLQSAVNAALPGDVLVLQNRIYTERVFIGRAGTAAAPITITGAGRGRSVLLGTVTLRSTAAFWRLQDMDVNANGGDKDAIRIETAAHDISLQRMHIYNGTAYGVRIGNDAANVLIEESEIDHFDAGDQDAHGIAIMTASNVTIRRCDIHHTSGDAIQSNTPDYPGYGRFASNILIERNRLHESRENALDVKSTHGLTARNNQMWGFAVVSSSAGMAIQVQHDAQDILIEGNQVWNSAQGIEVTRGKKNGTYYPTAPQRVTIAGNLFRDLGTGPGAGPGVRPFAAYLPLMPTPTATGDSGDASGIIIRTSTNVKVYNNTVLRAGRAGLYLGASPDDDYPRAVDVRNNVLEGVENDLDYAYDPDNIAQLIVDYNHYVGGRVGNGGLSAWLSMGYEHHPTSGDPRLDSSLLPRLDSLLRDSGVYVGRPFTGSAPDRGWGGG
jgi:hypothetical protein